MCWPYSAKCAARILKIFFMEAISPFLSIEARSPTPGHLMVKSVFLSQTDACSKIHAVFSDGLAEQHKQLLHAVASPFPGHAALKYGVFYISLSIDLGTGFSHSLWRRRRVDGVYLRDRF
jgi:hypothetical protein